LKASILKGKRKKLKMSKTDMKKGYKPLPINIQPINLNYKKLNNLDLTRINLKFTARHNYNTPRSNLNGIHLKTVA
jgi:hypothetical protein